MPLARTCSECGKSLAGARPGTKTCSNACRQGRSRRLRRATREAREFEDRNPDGAREIAAIVRREEPDYIKRVIQDELRPIVRDALTEETLRAIQRMLGLTPRAVELIAADLESEDATIRQRAYTLITKYTIGHPALVKADDADGSKQIIVNFSLPRPDAAAQLDGAVDADVEPELRVCDMCHEDKPESEFVAGSDRCRPCYEGWRQRVLEEFA